ncbi:hypothetical protein A2164_02520 [Candidatus Curtissbacteria bacterium RBG_13_35_7]|uniref:Trigger factor n=1 Tax=Candidatus Curtissbacteria bacterium RBG_13_35_7 TaxID=1797705 RepID=A0A1F5G2X5_9BACT|nr:MAG: hypothetical protein A2164_02520 [Candidatus Curtissbacteria bacterium RBG_13_35_7]
MQYTVNRGEKGRVEAKVDVPKSAFVEAYDKVLEQLGKEAKISGFRPGHIPRDVIESNVGANKILNETASFLISKHLSDIYKKENIVPLGSPSIAVGSLAQDSPFTFTATVTSKPQIKVGNWKKLKVKRVKAKEVTDKDVSDSIKNIYEAWKKQQESDKQHATSDKQENEEQKSGKFIYDAHGNKIFLKGEGETRKSFSAKASEDEIDDNFARKIRARDLIHLKELVRKDLEKIMADQVEAKVEEEIFEEMLKLAEVEVPDILIDDELNRIILRITQNLEQQNKKLEDYLKEQNTTLDALKAKLRPQAEKNVKVTLIMDEIGRSEKVEVTSEEIENAGKGVDQTKLSEQQKADLKNYLAVSIMQSKTLAMVKKAVTSSALKS